MLRGSPPFVSPGEDGADFSLKEFFGVGLACNSTRALASSEYLAIQETFGGDTCDFIAEFRFTTYGNYALNVDEMAAPATGILLHEYRRDVPPGWGPGIPDYSLKTYFDKLKMRYHVYDGADETVGPLVAGRLQGKAQTLAMTLRLPRPDGQVDTGSDALVRLSVDDVRDPTNPAIILQAHIPSGVQALCNKLRETFGFSEQEMASRALDHLFDFRRGKMSLQEYAVEFDQRMQEAAEKAGLEMNDVAHFYLFFKNAGLPAKFVEDVKMQVQGDLRRYQEARTLALRLSSKHLEHDAYHRDEAPRDNEAWYGDSWQDDRSYYGDYEDNWTDDSWYGYEDYDDGYGDSYYDYEEEWFSPNDDEEEHESYPVKGKGRGNAMGVGCSICGSKWHSASSCPVSSNPSRSSSDSGHGKGKQKGKSFGRKGFGKNKGYGKHIYGFRDFREYSKGKSKGKGKGKKGKRYYAEHPDDGYHLYGKTLSAHFGTDTFASWPLRASPTRPSTTRTYNIAEDDAPEFLLGASKNIARDKNDDEHVDEQAGENEKTVVKNLHFPMALYSDREHFHMIAGSKRRGLLVDPGASSGLIGSETLRDIVDNCMTKDSKKQIAWKDPEHRLLITINQLI